MKRSGIWVSTAFSASLIAGCGGSVEEGMPKDAATANPQPDAFKKLMEDQGKNMTNQKKKPAATPKPADEAPKK